MSNSKPCVFCDIVAGKSPETIIEFDNEHIVIFRDIRPASDYHYLAVPKNHMQNVRECTVDDKDLSKFLRLTFCVFLFSLSHVCMQNFLIFVEMFYSHWNAKWATQSFEWKKCESQWYFVWISLATVHQHWPFAYARDCASLENGIRSTARIQANKYVVLHGKEHEILMN